MALYPTPPGKVKAMLAANKKKKATAPTNPPKVKPPPAKASATMTLAGPGGAAARRPGSTLTPARTSTAPVVSPRTDAADRSDYRAASMGLLPSANIPGVNAARAASAANPTGGADLNRAYTGLANQQAPGMLPYAFAQPELILGALMQSRGMDPYGTNTGLYAALTPYMDAANALVPLAFANSQGTTAGDAFNWIANQGANAMRPGGQMLNLNNVLRQMRGLDPESAVGQMLMGPGLDPQDQIRAARDLVYAGAQGNQHPAMQAAIQQAFNSQALQFMQEMLGGQTQGNFLPYLLGSAPFQQWR